MAELRDYFRKPGAGGFWDNHVKRYSKSRRKAPIYWLLQSSKKNYALWIYYHRLDKDILFKALLNYVEPKIRWEESRLDELRSEKTDLGPAAKGAKKLDKDIERQDAFRSELRDFEDKLRRAANLHLDPDLNDGVVLNIAPLRELVPWKEVKWYWDDLMDGKYEWSSIGKQLREKGLVKSAEDRTNERGQDYSGFRRVTTMKTIALEQAENRIAEALKHQGREGPILLKGSDADGLLLRLPEGMDVDGVSWLEGPAGLALVIIQAKYLSEYGSESKPARPVFGSCQGMLTIVSEDDEHLKDFEEYMK